MIGPDEARCPHCGRPDAPVGGALMTEESEAVRLLKYAFHLRQHGERAPGGNETWAQFDRDAEAYLRSLDVLRCRGCGDPLIKSASSWPRSVCPNGCEVVEIPVEAGQTYLVNLAAGTFTPVRDRDHAGLGLPCGPCGGECQLDEWREKQQARRGRGPAS